MVRLENKFEDLGLDIPTSGDVLDVYLDQDTLLLFIGEQRIWKGNSLNNNENRLLSNLKEMYKIDLKRALNTLLQLKFYKKLDYYKAQSDDYKIKHEGEKLFYDTRLKMLRQEHTCLDDKYNHLNSHSLKEFKEKYNLPDNGEFYSKYYIQEYNVLSGDRVILGEENHYYRLTDVRMEIHWTGFLRTLTNRTNEGQEEINAIIKNDVGKNYEPDEIPFKILLERGQDKGWIIKSKESELATLESVIFWLEDQVPDL